MTPLVRRSYRFCEGIARTQAANFHHAFRLLPLPQYRGMCALYAFLRIADDLADESAPVDEKRRRLDDFRRSLDDALRGRFDRSLHPALAHTIHSFGIPVGYLHEAVDGVTMDLDIHRYETFDDLKRYCYRVASVVGLSCIRIWGFKGDAEPYAEAAGIAFQMTNILRDLAEDASRGRVYLPDEDLHRFGYSSEELSRGTRNDAFRNLMAFEARRAFDFYDASSPLVAMLPPPGRAVFLVMLRTYRALLERIAARDYDVFTERVRVSRWYKLLQVARALPVRWGLI